MSVRMLCPSWLGIWAVTGVLIYSEWVKWMARFFIMMFIIITFIDLKWLQVLLSYVCCWSWRQSLLRCPWKAWGSMDSSLLLGPLWLFCSHSWAVWEQSVLSPPTTCFVQRRQENCIHGDQTGSACLSCSLIMDADSFLPPTPNNRGKVLPGSYLQKKGSQKGRRNLIVIIPPPIISCLDFWDRIFHWRQQVTDWICPTFLFYGSMH